MPNHHTLLRQETFIPNNVLLSKLMEIGVSVEVARRALFYTGNCSVTLAVNWLMDENRVMVMQNEDQGRMFSMSREMMREEEDSDMEEEIEIALMLLVNKSLNMSSGQMSLAGARATARIIKKVKEAVGMETVAMWDQCGRKTEVREVDDTKEMEGILQLVKMGQTGMRFIVDVDHQWMSEGQERKVMAIFGEMEELEDMLGHLAIVS